MDSSKGGLGIRSLSSLNKAIFGKWNWRFAYEGELFWKQVIEEKYGEKGGSNFYEVRDGYVVRLWKAIKKV